MSALADLHTHTTASDGQYTPAELAGLAKNRGLSVLAVTDHDTIAGVDEAMAAGEALGLRVIRGVELSAREHHNFHILGYSFRDGDTELAASFQNVRSQCIDLLQDRRFTLPQRILLMGLALKELCDGETDVSRWLVKAQALAELPGITGYLQEAEPGQALPLFLSNCIRVLLGMPGIGDFQAVQNELIQGLGIKVQEGTTLATVPTAPYLAAWERYQERFAGRECFMENLMVSLFFELKMPTLTSAEDLWKSYVNFCNLYSIYRFMAVMSCGEGAAGDRGELFRLLVYASRGLIHDRASQTALRDNFFQNDSATLAHMSVLLSG